MYSVREVSSVLGVPSGRLRSYLRAGCVNPERGAKGELRFSFRDLVLLRKAELLVGKSIPPRRVARALRNLRKVVGEERPLSGFDLDAEGASVVVEEGDRRWCPDSRQMLLDFDRPPQAARTTGKGGKSERGPGAIAPLSLARTGYARAVSDGHAGLATKPRPNGERAQPIESLTTAQLFERACVLEDEDPVEARNLYRRVIELDPGHADAHVNLGRLLHEVGHPEAAQVHYRVALALRPEDPTASFNLGVALEDTAKVPEAIQAYQTSIACDPGNADAHYNLARLMEQSGKPDLSIRHLLIYRQLTRRPR